MEEMMNLMKELESLCREWREFKRDDECGRGWWYSDDNYAACYFAAESNHTAVRIGQFDIGFHNPPKIEFLIADLPKLPKVIQKGRAMLDQHKAAKACRTEQEKKEAIEGRRQRLLKQLEELGQPA